MSNYTNRNMLAAAERYAQADRSDPFALARARLHLSNGIASYANANGQAAYYEAEPYQETRYLPDGREYQATVYRNVVRP